MKNTSKIHKELLELLLPLVKFLNENNYSYLLIAGKDNNCSRYLRGNAGDIHGMITGMMENNPQVKDLFVDAVKMAE